MSSRRTGRNRGFTLIEMMVVLSIILILLGIAMPIYSHSIRRANEESFRQSLATLNRMIIQYTLDKQKPPKSLQDLKQAGYIKEVPNDITGKPDTWVLEPADAIMSLDQKETDGIIGVHSGSNQIAGDGTEYSTW